LNYNRPNKKIFSAAGEAGGARPRRGRGPARPEKRSVFRLDSAAYYRAKEEARYSTPRFSRDDGQDEPDDLIPPEIAAHFTTQLPLAQILAERGEDPRLGAAFELGGHMTQTMEIPFIRSEAIKAADTSFGVFVEIEEPLIPDIPGGVPATRLPFAEISPAPRGLEPGGRERDMLPVKPAEKPDGGRGCVPAADSARVGRPRLPSRGGVPPRVLAFLILFALLFAPLTAFSTVLRVVYIEIDGQRAHAFATNKTDVADMLSDAGLELRPADRYETEDIGAAINLKLERSARITVLCDGRFLTHYVLKKTTAEALAELGIELGEDDEITVPPDAVLREGDVVEVYRVRREYREQNETIPWQRVEKPSPLVSDGERYAANEGAGEDGAALRAYSDKYVNGELAATELVGERFTDFPIDEVTLVGDSGAVMSEVDGGEFSDIKIVDNAPESYQSVIEEGVCTAYSFRPGTYGASGMYLKQGFVAVDSSKIPLGSLLYITGPEGDFVYGWAVAADVGTAMMEGRVDVDCFFETYRESALFGRKYLNIYVVKQLTQDELAGYAAVSGMFENRIPA
jgi:3D (Asp-Asp-Asp) domain-containing protein/uncharacterized protein YabE (DUF348 family)